ncbi:MAG: hypothetical protein J7J67_03280 [Thermoproteales archaeon]|nr:hypothetical protein [Thermoproteales archaeon]
MSVDEVLEKIEELKRKYENDEELVKLLMQYEESLRESRPPAYSRRIQSLMFIGWIIGAAFFFILGLYLFFPPYVFFTYLHANATILQETLKAVYLNPRILSVADALFKLLGMLMMIMSVISMYQAHLLLGRLKKEESGKES